MDNSEAMAIIFEQGLEIQRLRADRDRWRELAKAIVDAAGERRDLSALWKAVEATKAHVSALNK